MKYYKCIIKSLIRIFALLISFFILYFYQSQRVSAEVWPDLTVYVVDNAGNGIYSGVVEFRASCQGSSKESPNMKSRFLEIGKAEEYCYKRVIHVPASGKWFGQNCTGHCSVPLSCSSLGTPTFKIGNDSHWVSHNVVFNNTGNNSAKFEAWGYQDASRGEYGSCTVPTAQSSSCQGILIKSVLTGKTISVPKGLGTRQRSECGRNGFGGCARLAWGGGLADDGSWVPGAFVTARVDGYNCNGATVRYGNDPAAVVTRTVTCTPISQAPIITALNKPPNCFTGNEFTFTIKVYDPEGATNIDRIYLKIGDREFWADIHSNGSAELWGYNPPLGANIVNGTCGSKVCYDTVTKEATIKIQVTKLGSLYGSGNIAVQARAKDNDGNWTGDSETYYYNAGTFTVGRQPIAGLEWASSEAAPGDIVNLNYGWSWVTSCTLTLSSTGSICTFKEDGSTSISCLAARDMIAGASKEVEIADDLTEDTECSASIAVSNGCFSASDGPEILTILAADPWVMTAFGDSYAFSGYTGMEMWKVESTEVPGWAKGVPPSSGNKAYFSTYIISKDSGLWAAERSSLREYLLGVYDDSNRARVGSSKVYEYLYNLAIKNDCDVCVYDEVSLPANCASGKNIYFLKNAGEYSLPSGWDVATSDATRACVVISSGDIKVPAAIDYLDAFFLLDGKFTTEEDAETLVINGSVIADEVVFGRDLSNDASNPAELIRYDPKYLFLLRDYLGEQHPFSIREYSYSTLR